ncbi:MAG: hypothetical protein H6742_19705 [Alphaproteobacteria bacterium]|nr:hypothetical protein [Alphaproteobacteria bacterium]
MRLILPVLALLAGCGNSFQGDYSLTAFDADESDDQVVFDGETGTLSVDADGAGTLSVELPPADGGDSWMLTCAFTVPAEEQTNFDPGCQVDLPDGHGSLEAGTHDVAGTAFMNTTMDGANTNFRLTPDSEDLWSLSGFYRFE